VSLDPDIEALLAERKGLRPVTELSPPEVRAQAAAAIAAAPPPPPIADARNLSAAGIPARLYRPSPTEGTPLIVYFHGGGWVGGSLAGSEATCRRLANASGCAVLSVDYRLAPEHKFPAAVEDAATATAWAAAHAADLGCDGERVAVAGESAGGNLAAVVALLARDAGGPPIARQLLVYPVIDARAGYPSYAENADGPALTSAAMAWYVRHYVRGPEDREDPRVSPILAGSQAGLPPATILTAEHDPLRDEGEAYAERLRADGVAVDLRRYDGMVHGFWSFAAALPRVERMLADVAGAFGAALRR
jgi:acetyl esterase